MADYHCNEWGADDVVVRLARATPFPLMQFTLTYDGALHANGNPQKKWAIRNHIHPQLKELWETNKLLQTTESLSVLPAHLVDKPPAAMWASTEPLRKRAVTSGDVDLCAPIDRFGRSFIPLIRQSLFLTCSLNILFLRKENPRALYSGDIDNRIKTLIDALKVPEENDAHGDKENVSPLYCLLEDDELVSDINIRTARLLSGSMPDKHVRLVIDVLVKVIHVNSANAPLLAN